MDVLIIVFIVLGAMLVITFLAWFYFTERELSKATILICDTVLIVLSIAVLVVGLQIRNRALEENRNSSLEQIENATYEEIQ